jgi:hypothetical protein
MLTTDRHPCPQRNSNLQSQWASGRKPTLRPRGHWLFVMLEFVNEYSSVCTVYLHLLEVWLIMMCRGVSADRVATRPLYGMQSAIFNRLSPDQTLSASSKLWNALDVTHYHVRVCALWTIGPQIVVRRYVTEQTRTVCRLTVQYIPCVLWKPKFTTVTTKARYCSSFFTRWIQFIFSQPV